MQSTYRMHQLAQVFQNEEKAELVKSLTAQLDSKELELGQISRDYTPYLQVRDARACLQRVYVPLTCSHLY
jgi:hypothetical protein